jgi:hypothetical protein
MTRLNVEDLEGRALMSAVMASVSAPVGDAAVVRVVDTGTAAAPHTSAIELENTLISNFSQSGSVSTQWSIAQTFPANEYD